jgi:hypothetical protein
MFCGRTALEPPRVDEDVEVEARERERRGEDVRHLGEKPRCRRRKQHAEREDFARMHPAAWNRTQPRPRHPVVDVAIEIHVDRVGAAGHEVSADEHTENQRPTRLAGDEHRGDRRDEEQRDDARLRQRDEVARQRASA